MVNPNRLPERFIGTPVPHHIAARKSPLDEGLTEPKISTEGRFLTCFSEDGDDLSQWRAYGGGEGGYALQFDSLFLRNLPPPVTTILGKVEHDRSNQDRFLQTVLTGCIRFFLDGLEKNRAPTIDAWM